MARVCWEGCILDCLDVGLTWAAAAILDLHQTLACPNYHGLRNLVESGEWDALVSLVAVGLGCNKFWPTSAVTAWVLCYGVGYNGFGGGSVKSNLSHNFEC
ncbi:hypothetical protein U1Q18_007473 [Sarracenia purpurea var. burkii]